MKYRILIKEADRPNGNSLYKYYKELDNDAIGTIWEATEAEDVDNKIKELLNTIPKSNLDVIKYGTYDIDAAIANDTIDDTANMPTDIILNDNTLQLVNKDGDIIGGGTQINVGGEDYDDTNDGIVDLSSFNNLGD